MPVLVSEYIKIKDSKKEEYTGVVVATDLIAVLPDGATEPIAGVPIERVKVHTKIECDSGAKCENSKVNDDFTTSPFTLEFDETGNNSKDFINSLSKIVIISDYKGEKKVYCSPECYTSDIKRQAREEKVVNFPSGKGFRTSDVVKE